METDDFNSGKNEFKLSLEMSELLKSTKTQIHENSKSYDSTTNWIAGGAVVFLANKIISIENIANLSQHYANGLIKLGIAFFLLSLGCTVTTYIFTDRGLRKIEFLLANVQKEVQKIGKIYRTDKVEANRKWRILWDLYIRFFQQVDFTNALFICSYLTFIGGLTLILLLLR